MNIIYDHWTNRPRRNLKYLEPANAIAKRYGITNWGDIIDQAACTKEGAECLTDPKFRAYMKRRYQSETLFTTLRYPKKVQGLKEIFYVIWPDERPTQTAPEDSLIDALLSLIQD